MTFTFGSTQQNSTMGKASSTGNSSSNSDSSTAGKRNPEVNTTWMPYNEHMASPVN